ncbi:hypothetical protein ADK57_25425 [Streptomyces sp. MMG1533]|nr:hypothetical protein ADK57_25425 [Streptomyces sp. MMG1533]
MTAAPALVSAVRSAKQYLTYVASGPFQYAVAEALALPDSYFSGFRDDMLAKRDLLATGLAEGPSGRASSPSRTPSSTTTGRRAPPSSASRSASRRGCWRRR